MRNRLFEGRDIFETIQFKGKRKDGSTFDAEARLGSFIEDGSRYDVAVVHDLTEQNRLRSQLEQSSKLAAIGEREKFDVVFCTVGIHLATSPETGFEIARLTKPQVAVPYHTNSAAYQHKFAEILKKELPRTTCVIPELNKIYQVSKRK